MNLQLHCIGPKYWTSGPDHKGRAPYQVSGGWLCTTWMILPGGYRGVEADRAMLRSLGWSHRQALGGAACGWVWASSSSGSSDLGMHLVPPAMILHCAQSRGGGLLALWQSVLVNQHYYCGISWSKRQKLLFQWNQKTLIDIKIQVALESYPRCATE